MKQVKKGSDKTGKNRKYKDGPTFFLGGGVGERTETQHNSF